MQNHRKQSLNTEPDYKVLVQSIKDYAIFMLDKKGVITSWDQGSVKLFGYKRKEVLGKKFSILFTKSDCQKNIPNADMNAAIEKGRNLDERQYLRKDKTEFWSAGVLTSNINKKGVFQGFSKIMRNVSQEVALHRTAVHNSTHDFLTGLPNRNYFEENLIKEVKLEKGKNIIAVFYMDFNNFKKTNDKYGHRIGDFVLIEIAHRLTHNIRISDLVARFGDDEFVMLVNNQESVSNIANIAKKILTIFKIPIVVGKQSIQTSISIGISLCPLNSKKPSDLLHFADMALYQAKKLGDNQYCFYEKNLSPKKN